MTHTIIENDLKYYYSSEEIKNLAALSSGCRKTQLADYVVDLANDSIIKSRATKQELIDTTAKTAKTKGNQYCVSFRAPNTRVSTIKGALSDLPVGFTLIQYRYWTDKWIVQIQSDIDLDEQAWEIRISEILTRYYLLDVIAFRIE